MVLHFLPRQWAFWAYYVAAWAVYSMPFMDLESLRSENMLWSSLLSDTLRVFVSLPAVLYFRYAYIKNKWYDQSLIELVCLVLGFNLIYGILIAYFLPYSPLPTNIWFEFFQTELTTTPRSVDEKVVSFFYSFFFLVLWCFFFSMGEVRNMTLKMEEASEEIKHALKLSRMSSLLDQVSPHFLFNGMNNICSLMDEDVQKAQKMLRAFSHLLRFSIDCQNKQQVPFHEELEFVRNYIAICSIQYEDKLQYSEDIAEDYLDLNIPPLAMQTLVENAVKHGVSKRPQGGEVKIELVHQQHSVLIKVSNEYDSDSAEGYHAVQRAGELGRDVGSGLEGNSDTVAGTEKGSRDRVGVGINNLRDRLQLIYGDKASFTLLTEGAYIVATLVLPRADLH